MDFCTGDSFNPWFAFKKIENSSLLIILCVKISLEMMFGDIIGIQIKSLQGI